MSTETFDTLGLAEPVLHGLRERGHTRPTPIQEQAIPRLLEDHDVLGIAQTGTGKTGAFALPILSIMADYPMRPARNRPRVLVLAPTRELAIQIADEFRAYGKHLPMRLTLVFGGVSQRPQVAGLSRGADIVVATPGRLVDLMNQGHVALGDVEHFVLDEADRMLDMGFARDLKRITAALPKDRQSLLFSATMPAAVAALAADILYEPVRVEVTPQATPVERIEQRVHHLPKSEKPSLLLNVLENPALSRVIVFTRTKHGADRVAKKLGQAGIQAGAIHGNKSQNARQAALKSFRAGRCRVLVATDIAARGIDVDRVSHVINFELPMEPENYVHRIGRTARAGADGAAISFCEPGELSQLRAVEKTIGFAIPAVGEPPSNPPASPERRRGKSKRGAFAPPGPSNGETKAGAGHKSGTRRRGNWRPRKKAA